MHHVLHLGIDVDDDVIKQTIINESVKEIKDTFIKNIKRTLVECEDLNDYKYKTRVMSMTKDCVDDFLERYRDEIAEITVERLVDRIMKNNNMKSLIASKAINTLDKDDVKLFLEKLNNLENLDLTDIE